MMATDQYFRENVHPAMVYMAERFCRLHPEYEIDELVNEIWLSEQYQTMEHPGMIWQASLWAMLRYHQYRHRKTAYRPTTALPEDSLSWGGLAVLDNNIDLLDFIEELAAKLPGRLKLILSFVVQGYTNKAIAKKIGVGHERVRQLKEKIREEANKILEAPARI